MSRPLSLRTGEVSARFLFQQDPPSITGTLKEYGCCLYYGYLNSDFFIRQATYQKKNLANLLIKENLTEDNQFILKFCLDLMHQSLETTWKYPALFNESNIETGRNRIFASYITQHEPWTKVPILMLSSNEGSKNILSSYQLIDNDQQLNEVLGGKIDNVYPYPKFNLDIKILSDGNQKKPKLEYIGDGNAYTPDPSKGLRWLTYYRQWWEKYRKNSTISIFTNWPELIKDSSGFWNYKVVGPAVLHKSFELPVWEYHNSPCLETDHVLWVRKPRKIDLADFLFWLNMHQSSYIEESSYDFVLYRKHSEYLSKLVRVPYYM